MLGNLAKDPHRNSGGSVNCVHFSVTSSLRRKIYHHAGNPFPSVSQQSMMFSTFGDKNKRFRFLHLTDVSKLVLISPFILFNFN